MYKTAICPRCGKEFQYSNIVNRTKKFCSDACRITFYKEKYKADRAAAPKTIYHITCEYCGKEVETESPQTRYCGSRCCHNAANARKRKGRESSRNLCPQPKNQHPVDDALRECREQGISYAERQKRKTLEMLKEKEKENGNT